MKQLNGDKRIQTLNKEGMKAKRKLVNEIVTSFKNEVDNWYFGKHTADNKCWGIEIWICNAPILDIEIYAPTKIKFNIFQKIIIYNAMRECRALKVLSLKNSKP